MISSSVWAAGPRTQQPLSPAPALLTLTVLAMLCAQLIWKWFDFLPGFLWLCCKWELLRGISLFCWPRIICPLSRWLTQVADVENRHQFWYLSCCSGREGCAAPSMSWAQHPWRALFHPLHSHRFWQALQFFSLPHLLTEDLYLVARGSWEPSICSNQQGSGAIFCVVAGGTVCTQISMLRSKGRH